MPLLADDDDQLALIIELPGNRMVEISPSGPLWSRTICRRRRGLRVDAYLPQAVLTGALVGVLLVVESDGDDRPFELRDGRKQLYRRSGLGLPLVPGTPPAAITP